MASALGFAAVGRFLQLPHYMSQGIKAAVKFLTWDNIEKTLAFIHEGNRLASSNSFRDRDAWSAITDLENELLRAVISFIAYYFPQDFNIHTTAAELTDSPRLPLVIESRPSISHTRLASIQFGDVSVEDSAKFDTSVLVSSILLSVPTPVLQSLFDAPVLGGKLGWQKISQIIRDTVTERENRRDKVRKTPKRVVPGASSQQWEAIRWEERVEASDRHPAGLAILRLPVTNEA